ncbi:TetR/AcrR family transcriptional regulator [Pseudobacillus sp. FSL P4-0506]|uniref:TetR/AcrR family transcriptional regulator n=1 Tax=unclassified Pseudobacillus TaxID=2619284 RepID=UPI0030F98FAF
MANTDRREELLHAALEIFATKGYHATKISDIVKQTGVAQGTFYWHFKSKEEIALEIIGTGKENLLAAIHQGYRQTFGTTDDMIKSSTALMKRIFTFAEKNRNLLTLLLIKGQGADPVIREAVADTVISIEEAFKKNIERAIELEMLNSNHNVDLQANMLTSLVIGTLSKWLFGPKNDLSYTPTLSVDEITRELVDFEFFGLIGQRRETD